MKYLSHAQYIYVGVTLDTWYFDEISSIPWHFYPWSKHTHQEDEDTNILLFIKYIFQDYINACILNKNIIIFKNYSNSKNIFEPQGIEGIKLKVIYWKDNFSWDLRLYFQKLNFTKKKKHYIFWKWFQNYHILINIFSF